MGTKEPGDIIPEDYKNHNPLPVVKKARKQKISVTNRFPIPPFFKSVQVKMIASYEQWITLEKGIPESLRFEEIPFSNPKQKDVELLKDFYLRDQSSFAYFFYTAFIQFASRENPLHPLGKKARGGSPYHLSPSEMIQVRIASAHVYIFLNYWTREKTNRKENSFLPEEFKLAEKNFGDFQAQPIALTMKLIEEHFDISLSQIDEKGFYDRYVVAGWASTIRRFYEENGFTPQKNPAKSCENQIFIPANPNDYSPRFQPLMEVILNPKQNQE